MTRVIAGVAGGRRLAVPSGLATRPTSDRAREGLFGTVRAVLGSLTGARVLDLYAGSGAVGLEALSRGAAHALLVESAPAAIRAIRANIAALDLPGACLVPDRVERVLARGPASLPWSAAPPGGPPGSVPGGLPGSVPGGLRGSVPGGLPGSVPGGCRFRAWRSAAVPGGLPGSAPGGLPGRVRGAGDGYHFVFADPPYAVGDDEIAATLRALRTGCWLADGALIVVERRTAGRPLAWPSGYVADRARRYGDATLWYGLAAGA